MLFGTEKTIFAVGRVRIAVLEIKGMLSSDTTGQLQYTSIGCIGP